jgi:hypothetical protein
MPNNNITILEDNTKLFGDELKRAILRALERCGSQGEGYAKDLCIDPSSGSVSTGQLKQAITHAVDPSDLAVYIGTGNVEHAVYVELGTGKYYPGGRPTPWNYEDENGDWHHTEGLEAHPYLVPAAKDHAQTYRNIFKDELGT